MIHKSVIGEPVISRHNCSASQMKLRFVPGIYQATHVVSLILVGSCSFGVLSDIVKGESCLTGVFTQVPLLWVWALLQCFGKCLLITILSRQQSALHHECVTGAATVLDVYLQFCYSRPSERKVWSILCDLRWYFIVEQDNVFILLMVWRLDNDPLAQSPVIHERLLSDGSAKW